MSFICRTVGHRWCPAFPSYWFDDGNGLRHVTHISTMCDTCGSTETQEVSCGCGQEFYDGFEETEDY